MMTVLMDNSLGVSSRERAQRLYNKNVESENRRRRSAQARISSVPNGWQEMRENYEGIILEDHAFSEQHETEHALWQLHYRRIEELRARFTAALASPASAKSQSGKVPARPTRMTEIRSQFKTFLSEAAGFYHDLMLKIRAKYGLPLGYISDDPENQIVLSKDGNKSAEMKKGLISCHRCLIYLGDLSRYKGLYGEGDSKARDFAAASSYYLQASALWPSSGNPHHQLAILAFYSGDELVAIYRYFRSLGVDNSFLTARDNLIIAFEKNRQNFSQLLGDAKASSMKTSPVRRTGKGRGKGGAIPPMKDNKTETNSLKENASSIPEIFKAFTIQFVRLNGILFTRTSLETFEEVFFMVRSDLLGLLSSGPEEEYNFGSDAADNGLVIVRLISILVFTVHNVNRETENQSYAEILQRSVLLQNAFTAVFHIMGHIIERCTQLHDPSASFLLPGVLVCMEWLACHPDIVVGSEVDEKQATARSFFWKNCISFLNKLSSSGSMSINEDEDETCFFNMSKYDESETANRLALWEDFELRGFLPLVPAQLILDFSRKQSSASDGNKEKKARVQRIIAAGKALAGIVQVGQQVMHFDPKLKKFAIGVEPQIADDLVLPSSLEMHTSNGIMQELSAEKTIDVGVSQPKVMLYMEDEEEEEEIVFKPSVTDACADANGPKVSSYEVLGNGGNASQGDFRSCVKSGSALPDGIFMQNAFDASSRPPISLDTFVPQHLQSIQPSTSKWLVPLQASIANGLNNLSLVENGHVMKPGLQEHYGVLQPAPLSLPLQHSVNITAGCEHYNQVSDAVIPSKFDSIMASGVSFDSLSVKLPSALPATLRKNPVSRPVRHSGPPPGFSPVPSKVADESLSGNTLKNGNMEMDDYSWLDGYQLPLSTLGTALSNSINNSAQSYHHGSKNSSLTGMASFPFPGKRVPTLQAQMENQKSWQDNQIPDYMKPYMHQQQQIKNINQQSIPLPEQCQRRSLWDDRFFV